MPGLIRINPAKESGCLEFDIEDLLSLVSPEGEQWLWSVDPDWVMLKGVEEDQGDSGMPSNALTERILSEVVTSQKGVILSWKEMLRFATSVRQTIWGTYVACEQEADFEGLPFLKATEQRSWYLDHLPEELYPSLDVVFQAVDSSFWLVYAKDDALLLRIASALEGVSMLRNW